MFGKPRFYIAFALGVALLLPVFTKSYFFLNVLIMIFLFGYISSCWNILGGLAGQHSFGHADAVSWDWRLYKQLILHPHGVNALVGYVDRRCAGRVDRALRRISEASGYGLKGNFLPHDHHFIR